MSEFIHLIGTIRGGALESELADRTTELVHAVDDTGKKGKLALEITIAPAGKGRVDVSATIKSTTPVHNTESSLFFVTEEGTLTRRDPRQLELPQLRQPQETESE